MSWRYIATRFNGDGTETIIAPELPLRDCSFSRFASAPADLEGFIQPEYRSLVDENGVPLLEKWSTGIYAERDGNIVAGGILVDDAIDPSSGSLRLVVMGLSGYPNGQPFTEGNTWPLNPYPAGGIEPMSAVRKIWSHLQSQHMGNIGVVIRGADIGIKIGKQVATASFDTENGPLSFEYEPFLLRDFETHDLGEKLSALHAGTPLSYLERHEWNDDHTSILHYLDYASRHGARRTDHRFVMGENVLFSSIDPPDQEYASTVLGIGAGEGATMIRSVAYRSEEKRIRRAIAFEDKSANTRAAINISAQAELLSRVGVDEITEIVVMPSHCSTLAALEPGDEVALLGDTPHRDVDMWVRIAGKTEIPGTGGLSFSVNRADRLA
ncbi:MAG: hypothetical protein H7201_02755 [Candidatus Saccharibacteria bacterium]|nr:hypothetical protein [Microbacteriaceae bacterium]